MPVLSLLSHSVLSEMALGWGSLGWGKYLQRPTPSSGLAMLAALGRMAPSFNIIQV